MFFQAPLCNDDDKGVILAPFSINEEEKSDYGTSSKLGAVQSELCMPIVKSWNFWSCQTIVQKVCNGSDTHYLLPGVYLIFPLRTLQQQQSHCSLACRPEQSSNIKFTRLIKALTKYERPKMKRDARQKCSHFLRKRLHFWRASLHFRPFVFRQGFSA